MLHNLNDFTFDTYERFLEFLKQQYDVFIPVCEASGDIDSFVIVRHDMDTSLKDVTRMAKMESKKGIISTYYLLLSNSYYNILNKNDLNIFKQIRDLGHEIGLHYDLDAYLSYDKSIEKSLKCQINLMENILDINVKSISMHSPSTFQGDPFISTPGYINAYTILKDLDIHYVSDSSRAWRFEYINKLIQEKPPRIQLCIHPLLWVWDSKVKNHEEHLDRLYEYLVNERIILKNKWRDHWNSIPHVRKYYKEIYEKKKLLDFSVDDQGS